MRKKNGTDSKEMEQVKALPVKYIKQPYPITAMQADLSRRQIRILVAMIQSIQEKIQDMFNRGNGGRQLFLFEELQSKYVDVEFRFSDISDRTDCYRDVENVAKKFMDIVFRYEDKKLGEVTMKHFVDEVRIINRGKNRHGSICFSFTERQARTLFNFSMFSKYIQSVAVSAESKYTARLYMLFSTYRGIDSSEKGFFHCYVRYDELRRMLGCDNPTSTGEWQRQSQKEYKSFKFNILKTAQKEMKEMSEAGKCDCWFEYKELPEDWKGEPESFDFIIHLNEIGRLEGGKSEAMKARKEVEELLKEKFSLTERECGKVLDGLNSKEELCRLEGRVEEIAEAMQKKGDAIKNGKLYAKKSLSEAVKDIVDARNVQVVEVKEESKAQADAAQAEVAPLYTDADSKLFTEIKDSFMKHDGDTQGIDVWLPEIYLEGVDDTKATVSFPTKAFAETFQHLFGTNLFDKLKEAFGRELSFMYRDI